MTKLNQHIHDLRKPLNSVSMQAELIKMLNDMPTPDSAEKITQAANTIIAQAKACSEQLQQLFEFLEQQQQNNHGMK